MVRSTHARTFITAMAVLGVAEMLSGGLQWQSSDLQRFICYLAIALTASILKVAFPVAAIIALTESKSFRYIWRTCYFWTFPYYMIGAGMAEILHIANRHAGWQISIFVLPLVFVIFRSYRQYLDRLEGEKSHAEQ